MTNRRWFWVAVMIAACLTRGPVRASPPRTPALKEFAQKISSVSGKIRKLGKQLRKRTVLLQPDRELSAAERKAQGKVAAKTKKIMEPWHADLKTLWEADPGQRARLTSLSMVLLAAWADLGSAASIQSAMKASYPALLPAIKAANDDDRRDFLDSLAHMAPSVRTHLDALLRVVEWDALLSSDKAKGSAQLVAITADLILLFTEKSTDARTDAKTAKWYKPGRFRDHGFAARLRDGSDQVRHVTWALRVFAICGGFYDLAEGMMARRERGNQKDVDLNRAARKIVEEILGPAHPPASDYSGILRKHLGSAE